MASPILDEGGQLERAAYIYGHGPKEGLVERAAAWPGVASVRERLTGRADTYAHLDRTALSRATYSRREKPEPEEFTKTVQVSLSPWPFLADRTPASQRRRIAGLVAEAERQARVRRGGRRCLGRRKVLAQDPWDRPRRELRRTPNPLCHATSDHRRDTYREGYSNFVDNYRQASIRFRQGDVTVPFPRFSYRPPLPLELRRLRAGPRAGPPRLAG